MKLPSPHNEAKDKNALRIHFLARRERQDARAADAAADVIIPAILKVVSGTATIVAGYSPMRGELNIIKALSPLAERGHSLCLPGIEAADKPLHFRRWRIGEPLEKGRYGVDIPPPDAPLFKPDVVLVPMVAFDREGNRLGYGAGYYDRTIRGLRERDGRVQIIGVAFAMQETPSLPSDPHDEKMDVIVTEKEIIRMV